MGRLDRAQLTALLVPLLTFVVLWLTLLAIPVIHQVCMKRSMVDCRGFRRSELRGSVLGLWDVLRTSGVLSQPGVMLDWGTLLGAVRGGDLIEHDYDIDIRAPADRICSLYWRLRKAAAPYPYLTCAATHIVIATGAYPSVWVGDTRYGTGLDIEPYVVEGGRVHRASYCWMLRRCEAGMIPGDFRSVPESDVFPLQYMHIRGARVAVPARATSFLTRYYGPNWKVPLVKKRTAQEAELPAYTVG